MKLLIQAAMVFFATLLAAALVALGVPIIAELVTRGEPPPDSQVLAFAPAGAAQETAAPRQRR